MAGPSPFPVRAGQLRGSASGSELHDLSLGAICIAERLYVGVRDENWNSVAGDVSVLASHAGADEFSVEFDSRHRGGAIDFEWRGSISGSADGTVRFSMEGEANSEFAFSRIGISIHHPLEWSCGRRFRARSSNGETTGRLPAGIDPGIGQLRLFAPYDQLTIWPLDGLSLDFEFEGDLWEMQDHRNWGDTNFKSYATPMTEPYPRFARPGQRFVQRVVISARGHAPRRVRPPIARLNIGDPLVLGVPQLGIQFAGDGAGPLTSRGRDRVRALRLEHLRMDVALDADWLGSATAGADACLSLDLPAELAVRITLPAESRLERLRDELAARGVRIARVLVYASPEHDPTPGGLVRLARECFGTDVPILGGTSLYFSLINSVSPALLDLDDGVVFPFSPQLHAAEDRWVIANASGAGEMVERAKEIVGDRAVAVSPVSLVNRGGPFPAGLPVSGKLPGEVDVRQRTSFLAAWTVETLRRLTEAGAGSATFFETHGWRGLFESDTGGLLPELFPSRPGEVFPVYEVFAMLADRNGAALDVDTTAAEGASAFAFQTTSGPRVLVANLTPAHRRLEVSLGVEDVVLSLGPYEVVRL